MPKIGYFLRISDDELFYSTVARYHQLSMNYSYDQTLKELSFKKPIRMDIYQDVSRLLKNLSHFKYQTEKEIINSHSFYRYYAAFCNNQGENLLDLIVGKDLKKLNKNTLFNNKHLKFCEICYQEEKIQGVPYWHVSHNIPGVCVCEKHEIFLNESQIFFNEKYLFVINDEIVESSRKNVGNINLEMHIKFLKESLSLFNMKLNIQELKKIYLQKLYEVGYIENYIKSEILELDFALFFGKEFFEIINLSVEVVVKNIIGFLMFTNNLLPIYHVLIVLFLDLEFKSIGNIKIGNQFLSFREEHLTCKNPFCFKFNKIINKIVRTMVHDEYFGLYLRCNCNYEYFIKVTMPNKRIVFDEGINSWNYIIYWIENDYSSIEEMSDKFNISKDLIAERIDSKKRI